MYTDNQTDIKLRVLLNINITGLEHRKIGV